MYEVVLLPPIVCDIDDHLSPMQFAYLRNLATEMAIRRNDRLPSPGALVDYGKLRLPPRFWARRLQQRGGDTDELEAHRENSGISVAYCHP